MSNYQPKPFLSAENKADAARIDAAPTMYQHLRCTNDLNGNPRRVFVFYDAAGGIVAVEDEGYRGAPAACRGLVQLPTIETYPAERRALLKEWPTLKQAQEAAS
jgi:hypothetical protein